MDFFKLSVKFHLIWIIFFAIILFEIAAFFFLSLGSIGMYFWLSALFIFVSISIYSIFYLLKTKSVGKIFVILIWLIMIGLILFNATKPRNISFETTQEAACSINFWTNSIDKGFHRSCFLGYPSRQYLLLATPSMIFGPSLVILNLGGSLFFVFSMFLWGTGLFLYSNKRGSGAGFFTGLSIAILLHFHYFNHFLFNCFEQSQFPLSISMSFWGVYLWYLVERKKWHIPLLGLLMLFMAQMYTSAIAFLVLAACLLVGLYSQKKIKLWGLLTILIGVSISFGLTFTHRDDLRLTGENNRSIAYLIDQGWSLLQHLFWKTQGVRDYSSLLGKAVLAVAMFSGVFLKSKKVILLAVWFLASTFVATVAQGYSYYGLDFRVHRSLVVVPTVILLVIIFFQQINEKVKISFKLKPVYSKLLQWAVFMMVTISGIIYANQYLRTQTISPHFQLIQALKSEVPQIENKEEIIFTTKANSQFISLDDSMGYFLPNLKKKVLEPGLVKNISADRAILVLDAQEKKFLPEKLQQYDQLIFYFPHRPLHIIY